MTREGSSSLRPWCERAVHTCLPSGLGSLSAHQGGLGPLWGESSALSLASRVAVSTVQVRPHRELTQSARGCPYLPGHLWGR